MGLLLAANLAAASASAVEPPAYPPLPRTIEAPVLRRWLVRNTDWPRRGPMLLTSNTALTLLAADGPTSLRRTVRQEVFSPALAAALGGRSLTLHVRMDCGARTALIEDVEVYPGNSRRGGPPRGLTPAAWIAADPQTDLGDLAVVACAPGGPAAEPAPAAGGSPAVWVQIGAFRSEAAVQERWRSLLGRLGEPLDGIGVRAEAVSAARGAMKRALVGPFASKLDARAFCAKALQVKSDCFVR